MTPGVTPLLVPTQSRRAEPIRLLRSLTTPVLPVAPSIQVTAPLSSIYIRLKTSTLPLRSAMTLSPMVSPLVIPPTTTFEPTKLLLLDTSPEIPVVPLPQVTAPFDVIGVAPLPPPQYCERTM